MIYDLISGRQKKHLREIKEFSLFWIAKCQIFGPRLLVGEGHVRYWSPKGACAMGRGGM